MLMHIGWHRFLGVFDGDNCANNRCCTDADVDDNELNVMGRSMDVMVLLVSIWMMPVLTVLMK